MRSKEKLPENAVNDPRKDWVFRMAKREGEAGEVYRKTVAGEF